MTRRRCLASPAGYLWDNCARHGVTFRSYGEEPDFSSSKSDLIFTGAGGLAGHTSPDYEKLKWEDRDSLRTAIFLRDFRKSEKSGEWVVSCSVAIWRVLRGSLQCPVSASIDC